MQNYNKIQNITNHRYICRLMFAVTIGYATVSPALSEEKGEWCQRDNFPAGFDKVIAVRCIRRSLMRSFSAFVQFYSIKFIIKLAGTKYITNFVQNYHKI